MAKNASVMNIKPKARFLIRIKFNIKSHINKTPSNSKSMPYTGKKGNIARVTPPKVPPYITKNSPTVCLLVKTNNGSKEKKAIGNVVKPSDIPIVNKGIIA